MKNYYDVTVHLEDGKKLSTVTQSDLNVVEYAKNASTMLGIGGGSFYVLGVDDLELNIVANSNKVLAVTVEKSNYPERVFPYDASDL